MGKWFNDKGLILIGIIFVVSIVAFTLSVQSSKSSRVSEVCMQKVEKVFVSVVNNSLLVQNEQLRSDNDRLKSELDVAQRRLLFSTESSQDYNSDLNPSFYQIKSDTVLTVFDRQVWLVGKGASTDYWRMSCKSDSMMPMFNCSDTLIAYKPTRSEIKAGDVVIVNAPVDVTYNPLKYNWFVHQVTWREGDWIGTKGINNPSSDYPTHITNVTGKIWQ